MKKFIPLGLSFLLILSGFTVAFIYFGFEWIVLFLLLFVFSLWLIIPLLLSLEKKKYIEVESQIYEPILLKQNVNLNINGIIRNGNIYITKNNIHIYGRSKKPYLEGHLKKDDLSCIEVSNNVHIKVFVSEDSHFIISSAGSKDIIKCLLEGGWIHSAQ